MSTGDYDCHPVPLPDQASIMAMASRVHVLADRYRTLMDERTNYRDVVRAGAALARASHVLTTAIADAIACDDSPDSIVSQRLTRSGVSSTF